jgi:hypothetical protein
MPKVELNQLEADAVSLIEVVARPELVEPLQKFIRELFAVLRAREEAKKSG